MQYIGVIGMDVMGKNLALNIENKGYSVAIFNRSYDKTEKVLAENQDKNLIGTKTIGEFVASLEKPRKIILMIKAGKPVDETLDLLLSYIEIGDIVIDGGNSFFKDTIRRTELLAKAGVTFVGMGVSGGEEGALKGPAIMPGGTAEAYEKIGKLLCDISAKLDGEPCCIHIGTDGSGHYVKMVHNGIEYADMQLICESYNLIANVTGLSAPEISKIFGEWNNGELNSYLVEITRDILNVYDNQTGNPLVDVILDKAQQKGTGKWTSISALDLGVDVSTITQSVFARCMSSDKDNRINASNIYNKKINKILDKKDYPQFIESVRKALYASKICAYTQGFALLKAAAAEYNWDLDFGSIAMIFRGGCIIRAQFLHRIKEAYDTNKNLQNLLINSYFKQIMQDYELDFRFVASIAAQSGIPSPAFMSALSYYDQYTSENLPANLLQAQRDYFGAHTFERTDKPGNFHHKWIDE